MLKPSPTLPSSTQRLVKAVEGLAGAATEIRRYAGEKAFLEVADALNEAREALKDTEQITIREQVAATP